MNNIKGPKFKFYTKHCYASAPLRSGNGSERISSTLGTINELGLFCETPSPSLCTLMNSKLATAGTALSATYAHFGKELVLSAPYWYNNQDGNCPRPHNVEDYAASCIRRATQGARGMHNHPDHLGSSSYITNLSGEISQHTCPERSRRMEYLPFGETLIEEHLNSNNSPYKFNAKEFDSETGNYYYGARYYDPKWSIWLSVDPIAEEREWLSPYNFVQNNPINRIDPDGALDMSAQSPDDWVLGKDGKYTWDANVTSATDADLNGREYIGKSIQDVSAHYAENRLIFMIMWSCKKVKKTYYSNGILKTEAEISNSTYHGLFKSFYEDGKLEFEVPYYKGLMQGHGTYYHKSGNQFSKTEALFRNDTAYYWWNYDKSGNLIEEGSVKKNSKFGKWVYYDIEDGFTKKIREVFYINGKTHLNQEWGLNRQGDTVGGRFYTLDASDTLDFHNQVIRFGVEWLPYYTNSEIFVLIPKPESKQLNEDFSNQKEVIFDTISNPQLWKGDSDITVNLKYETSGEKLLRGFLLEKKLIPDKDSLDFRSITRKIYFEKEIFIGD